MVMMSRRWRLRYSQLHMKWCTRNERVGSLAVAQPTSVDCIIEDFAVESQLFALGLVQSTSLAAASFAVTVLGDNDDRPILSRSEVNPNLGAGWGLSVVSRSVHTGNWHS
jgi:hypothetical protein